VSVVRVVETVLPTEHAEFRCYGYSASSGVEHVVLVIGDVAAPGATPLVRLHSECLTGDVLSSRRCDCGPQLDAALRAIGESGCGVLVYLRGHEGRGIGLIEKLRAYRLQDGGLDTVDANLELGHAVDARQFSDGVAVLADLGVTRLRLMSNNPRKRDAVESGGIDVVDVVPIWIVPNRHNRHYLDTKRARMGHTGAQHAASAGDTP
jgi:3,4-dihydroxy 2-butanone 4-phosphate synthase/GTP cyclohydrolase II